MKREAPPFRAREDVTQPYRGSEEDRPTVEFFKELMRKASGSDTSLKSSCDTC